MPKRSALTKRMLGPPKKKEDEKVHPVKSTAAKAEMFMPGLPVHVGEAAQSHCRGAFDKDDPCCLASVVKGGRCKRTRTHGNFCKQHAHEMKKPERQNASWNSLEEALEQAAINFENQQLHIAVQRSMEENEGAMKRRQDSIEKLAPRLAELGLERVDTAAQGDCQFLAVSFSAGLPVDVQDFRCQVVQYLKHCADIYSDKVASKFRSFQQYVEHMCRPGTWGDELTLAASSHLLLRPIVVLSDDDREGERRFEPPSVIHESVWGPPIYIAYLNSSHYEATAPLAKPGEGPTKKTTIRIKHEKVSWRAC